MSNFLIVSLILLAVSSLVGAAEGIDSIIKKKCGVHPVIVYLKDLKEPILDPQILEKAKNCVDLYAKGKVIKWDLGNAEIAGCLTRTYGYNAKYVKELASLVKDANQNTQGLMKEYEGCVNRVRGASSSTAAFPVMCKQTPVPWTKSPYYNGTPEGEYLGVFNGQFIGWAWDRGDPSKVVLIDVYASDEWNCRHILLATVPANQSIVPYKLGPQGQEHGFRVATSSGKLTQGHVYTITVLWHGTRTGVGHVASQRYVYR